ncbi:SRPBCC domain-containing protein [Amycolatopsis rhabdoformis]|uniref:SRPBCC domain-containing protein n=1 Tax=Amycolatopsis rhabdoformis TaxID=1448059 RepID=A0ABZ1HX82_9PSEU|nr:SRPBCC domain-containing protein [Amycolatopsis rhabdoformis]WSE26454.1 SRPBCC domain-containing protein [Amycolatopsis rhabdoformis]
MADLVRTEDGFDLVLRRTFAASVQDVWAEVTEPHRTALWFGPWEVTDGKNIRVRMVFEEGEPWVDMRIEACEAPVRLALMGMEDAGGWPLELLVSEVEDGTELRLVHHLRSADGIGEIGPGWEYYLDLLVAARDDSVRPSFDDYYPALKASFEALRG